MSWQVNSISIFVHRLEKSSFVCLKKKTSDIRKADLKIHLYFETFPFIIIIALRPSVSVYVDCGVLFVK